MVKVMLRRRSEILKDLLEVAVTLRTRLSSATSNSVKFLKGFANQVSLI